MIRIRRTVGSAHTRKGTRPLDPFIRMMLVVAVLLFAAVPSLAAPKAHVFGLREGDYLRVSQISRGMKGEARTTVQGEKVVSFPVEVMGIITNGTGRPANLILVKASGPVIEKTGGIAAGMSGSPVYIKGKLIGAIGYGWDFSDHRIGMVTPIEDMLSVPDWPDSVPPFASVNARAIDMAVKDKLKPKSGDVSGDVPQVPDAAERNTPLQIGGLNREYASKIAETLGRSWYPAGKSGGGYTSTGSSIKGGSAMAVLLAWGDVEISAFGTITAVQPLSGEGAIRRFMAFGHPFMGKGAVAYAVAEASVVEVIPSAAAPFKIANRGPLMGMLTQDRPEGVSGYLGKLPPATEYTVSLTDIDTGKKSFRRFQTVADPFITGVISPMAVEGAVSDMWGQSGEGTAKVEVRFEGGGLLRGWSRGNYFMSSTNIVRDMLLEFVGLNASLPLNPFREIRPLGVHIKAEITSKPRVMYIEKLEFDDRPYMPGDEIEISVTLRPWRKAPEVRKFKVRVPEDASGMCTVMVRAGGIAEPQQEALMDGSIAIESLASLLRELSVMETNNQIVAEVVSMPKDMEPTGGPPKLLSQIKAERMKEGSYRVAQTNYYVDGFLRRDIDIDSGDEELEQDYGKESGKDEKKKEQKRTRPAGSAPRPVIARPSEAVPKWLLRTQ